MEHSYHIQR